MGAPWRDFLRDLGKPEYVHVLLNPLPTYGLAAALLALLAALVARSRPAQSIALGLFVLFCASAWPVVSYGGAAYDRVYSMLSSPDAQHWLNWHAYLADRIVWVYMAAAALGLLTLLSFALAPRLARAGLTLALVFGFLALALGGFLAFVGGKIRHPEFRHGPPPVILPRQEED